jgi:hypothetical protein
MRWRYHPDIEHELVELIAGVQPDVVMIMLQGEQAITAGLTAPTKYFDFFFPGEEDYYPDPSHEIIPYFLIFEATLRRYELIDNFLNEIKGHLPQLCFTFCPPPPASDVEHILKADLKHGGISESISRFGLPSLVWRHRMWRLHITALRSIYEKYGVGFLNPPSQACDEAGYLQEAFRGDVFHANAAYGGLLLNQISQVLQLVRERKLVNV